MATNKAVAKKVVPAVKTATKKVRTHAYLFVEKNNYSKVVSDLANSGATIVAITTNSDTRNSFDIHYFTEK